MEAVHTQDEIREIKSFASFLHLALVKVFRDREERVQCYVPDDTLGYDLLITIERVPQGCDVPKLFIEPEHLIDGITHPPKF